MHIAWPSWPSFKRNNTTATNHLLHHHVILFANGCLLYLNRCKHNGTIRHKTVLTATSFSGMNASHHIGGRRCISSMPRIYGLAAWRLTIM